MDGHEIDFNYLKENPELWTYESFKYMLNNSYYLCAKFIFENGKINMGFDTYFAELCRDNDIEKATFLAKLCDRYEIETENDKIISFKIDYKIDYRDLGNCPICYETKKGITTKCNHFFCEKCFPNILLISAKCPMCRKNLE